ncbi:uncharacterized protein LOC130697865 [Daphnia carinata]|uniref:uncharacterized protein LOC130697865 n=1 Tax=Daphnia carinata TaxID=120202 RepID=UPI00257FEEFF|nr:uncharacterized protein LOC130697865 [Daphnia carinata]
MEELQGPNYEEMSLEDVIRDMKAKKALKQENVVNNSPFLRHKASLQYYRRPFRAAIQPGQFNRSNYLKHMAKKQIQRARRTLDLRQRLIDIRANKKGMDLRSKLVAKMIIELRQQATKAQSRQKFHPFPQSGHSLGPRSGPCGPVSGVSSRPKINTTVLSQVEKLVGKLPSWMKTAASYLVDGVAPLQPNHPRPARFSAAPVRTVPTVYSPPTSNFIMARRQHSSVAPNHVHPCCQVSPTQQDLYQTHHSPPPSEMPPLAYEPLPIIRQTATINPRRFDMIRTSELEEDIAISVLDVGDELPRVKLTLNERFTK